MNENPRNRKSSRARTKHTSKFCIYKLMKKEWAYEINEKEKELKGLLSIFPSKTSSKKQSSRKNKICNDVVKYPLIKNYHI